MVWTWRAYAGSGWEAFPFSYPRWVWVIEWLFGEWVSGWTVVWYVDYSPWMVLGRHYEKTSADAPVRWRTSYAEGCNVGDTFNSMGNQRNGHMKKGIVPATVVASVLATVPEYAQDALPAEEGAVFQDVHQASPAKTLTADEAFEAGLLKERLPEIIIPLDELSSKEDLLRMAKEIDISKYVADGTKYSVAEPQIPESMERVLEAIEAGDDDRLDEILSEIAGTEVRHARSGFVPHGDAIPWDSSELLSIPADEVLGRMRPEHVQALTEHRDLLDTNDLIRKMDELSELEREAALEFRSIRFALYGLRTDPPESMITPEQWREMELAQERGWGDAYGAPTMGSSLLALAKRDKARATAAPAPLLAAGTYADYIPETAVSFSFTVPGSDERSEVIAETKFGACCTSRNRRSPAFTFSFRT